MIRIRFHGRGGQGMKTASRIVGTAAILDGWVAQDSPVYGAERRGAPMSAYVRIARTAVLERGIIAAPHLVVVADDTLVDDEAIHPLQGLAATGTLLITTSRSPEEVRGHTPHQGPVVARDFVALALEETGHPAAVSAALGAAACALLGLSESAAAGALRSELAAIGLRPAAIEANLRLAERARAGLGPMEIHGPELAAGRPGVEVVEVVYAPPDAGTATITAEPNTALRRTGNWRVFRPVIDLGKCTRCWICFVRCPDGAIALDAEDTPEVDYDVCKGCLICVEECPTHTIRPAREGREWAPVEVGV